MGPKPCVLPFWECIRFLDLRSWVFSTPFGKIGPQWVFGLSGGLTPQGDLPKSVGAKTQRSRNTFFDL